MSVTTLFIHIGMMKLVGSSIGFEFAAPNIIFTLKF